MNTQEAQAKLKEIDQQINNLKKAKDKIVREYLDTLKKTA